MIVLIRVPTALHIDTSPAGLVSSLLQTSNVFVIIFRVCPVCVSQGVYLVGLVNVFVIIFRVCPVCVSQGVYLVGLVHPKLSHATHSGTFCESTHALQPKSESGCTLALGSLPPTRLQPLRRPETVSVHSR